MDDQTFKDFLADRMSRAAKLYVKDLEAIEEPVLARSPGGAARVPFDFTYEVVFVNERIAKRLRGEDPGAVDLEGWMRAPEEFRDKARAVAAVRASVDEILTAWNALPAADLTKKIALPGGETTPLKLADLCITHLVYHDAQLNYVQSLHGDDEMHWD